MSVNAVGKPIMITTTMSTSMVSPRAGSLMSGGLPPYRAGARFRRFHARVRSLSCAFHRPRARVRELLFDDVDLRDVLETARPFAGLETDDATHDLRGALEHHQDPGDRNHCLELINRRALRRDRRMLPDGPRFRREDVSRVNERRDSGNEEDDVQHQVETSLHP